MLVCALLSGNCVFLEKLLEEVVESFFLPLLARKMTTITIITTITTPTSAPTTAPAIVAAGTPGRER